MPDFLAVFMRLSPGRRGEDSVLGKSEETQTANRIAGRSLSDPPARSNVLL